MFEAAFEGVAADDFGMLVDRAHTLLARHDWLPALLAPLIANLADDPWFQPPLRAIRDRLRIGALLVANDAISITATILSASAMKHEPAPSRVVVPGRIAVTRYLGGPARLRRWRRRSVGSGPCPADADTIAALPDREIDGDLLITLDGRAQAHLVDQASADVIAITAVIQTSAAPAIREYAIADGGLIRRGSLDDGASRSTMLLTLLRLAGRKDASDAFERATREPAFHLRWHAMREWLATDTQTALPRLAEMAGDPHPSVASAATRMLAQIESRFACLA